MNLNHWLEKIEATTVIVAHLGIPVPVQERDPYRNQGGPLNQTIGGSFSEKAKFEDDIAFLINYTTEYSDFNPYTIPIKKHLAEAKIGDTVIGH